MSNFANIVIIYTMKKIVLKDLMVMGASILLTVILVNLVMYRYIVSSNFAERSEMLFSQVELLIETSEHDANIIIEDFDDLCLDRAESAAYIIGLDHSIVNDDERLYKLANILECDELHIFDANGVLYSGTEPLYYGLSFNSGKQMQYFLPMLEDHDLKMCQDIVESTSQNKLMKYSASWVNDEIGIVQLGFLPNKISKLESSVSIKNVFSKLVTSDSTEILAIDKNSGEVLAASDDIFYNLKFFNLVDEFDPQSENTKTFVFKDKSYRYVAREIDDYYLIRTYENSEFIHSIIFGVLSTAIYITIVLFAIILWIFNFINKSIIKNLNTINSKLDVIVGGNTDIELPRNNIKEFNKLNSNINKVVNSLISYIRKITVVFDLTKTKIGVIDYPDNSSKILITGNVKDILGINKSDFEYLTSNPEMFVEKIDSYKQDCNLVDDNVYRITNFDGQYRYVEIEEIRYENSDITILRDVTDERNEIMNLEVERDTDVLTNILNRRAFINELSKLFKETSKLAFGYIAVADIDDLKEINDTYGHAKGDEMIVKVAKTMDETYKGRKAIFGRVGGDEFAIFEYGFNTLDEVKERIEVIDKIKSMQKINIDGSNRNIHFSIGYALFPIDSNDYQILLHIADNSMYDDKRKYKILK